MQGNPCYARLFADLTHMPPNPIIASGGQSRAPPVAGGARRKPSEQGSARKAPRADAARLLRTALRPPNPRGFFDKLGAARRAAPLAAKRRRPPHVRPFLPVPTSNRRMAGGGALAKGRGEKLGHAGGRRRFAGPGGPQNQSMGGGQRSPPMLCARCARPPPPPGPLGSSTGQTIHPPTFPTSTSYKQNEPAAPDERRASIIRCKPRKVFQPVFPRFFQKRARGCGGRVAPHTTTLANCGRGGWQPPTWRRDRAQA